MVPRTSAIRQTQVPTEGPIAANGVTTLFRQATTLLNELAEKVAARRSARPLFDHAEATLQQLPLATDEFTVARRRLHNALRYQHEGEYGAATFELRLMARSLSHCDNDTE